MPSAKRTKSFSARFSAEVVELLGARSERLGESKARVAERLIEEGLRIEQFPGIVFRAGPTGRRAGIAGGPDVWEIARDLKGVAGRKDKKDKDPIEAVASVTGLDRAIVELAANYYATYPDDIDERIRANQQAAERMRDALTVPSAA
jgi:hypothetical protein